MLGAGNRRILAGMVKCDFERRTSLAMMGSCLACRGGRHVMYGIGLFLPDFYQINIPVVHGCLQTTVSMFHISPIDGYDPS